MNKKNLVLFCLLGFFQAVFAQTVNSNSTISVLNSLLEKEQVKDIQQVFNYKYFFVKTRDYEDGVLGMDGKWLIELGEYEKIDAFYNIVWCTKEVENNEYVVKIYDMQNGKELHTVRAFGNSDSREKAELEMLDFFTNTICGAKKHNIKSGYYVDFKSMYVDIDLINNTWDKACRDGYIKLTGEGGYDAIFKDGKVFYNTNNRNIEYLGNGLFIENKSLEKSMKILTFDNLLSN